jgi:hypothetical protein
MIFVAEFFIIGTAINPPLLKHSSTNVYLLDENGSLLGASSLHRQSSLGKSVADISAFRISTDPPLSSISTNEGVLVFIDTLKVLSNYRNICCWYRSRLLFTFKSSCPTLRPIFGRLISTPSIWSGSLICQCALDILHCLWACINAEWYTAILPA